MRPDDQLDLSPEELEKEVPPRVLYPLNPRRSCGWFGHVWTMFTKPRMLLVTAGLHTTRPSSPSRSSLAPVYAREATYP